MKIVSLIVLYYPERKRLEQLLNSLVIQTQTVLLVDNTPSRLASDLLESSSVVYIHNKRNVGIAEAHNIGLKESLKLRADYTIIFDQDSSVTSDLVMDLKRDFEQAVFDGVTLAAIGPTIVCEYSREIVKPTIQKALIETKTYNVVPQIISSGMLVNMRCLEVIGLKESSLFIDGVDHEWCWRAKSFGFNVAISKRVDMWHRLGEARKSILGVAYRSGTPIRLYYQFRNVFLLARRSYVPFYWKFRNLSLLPFKLLVNTFLEESRIQRVKYMLRGILDGIAGKSGSYES